MNNRPKYDGKIHNMRGHRITIYSDYKGDMYAWSVCSCGGCFEDNFKLEENDIVRSFKYISIQNGAWIRNIKLIAMIFNIGEQVKLDNVRMESHESAIDFYCGGQLFDNYGIDGRKSFAAGLIKELKKDGIDVSTCIELPAAAKNDLKI